MAVSVNDYPYDMSQPAIEARLSDGWSSGVIGS